METRLYRALLTMMMLATAILAKADNTTGRVFTPEQPLVYEDAWDLWPYTYLNENGDPEGYNIDLLRLLCKEMDIPYVIKLKPTSEALQDLKDGKSDLMMGMAANFHDEYARYSTTVIQLFTHSVVYPKTKPVEINKVYDLANHRAIVHDGSFSHHLMEDNGWGDNAVPYDDMKEAIVMADAQQDLPIVWNTLSLKWLMHTFNIQNMDIKPIDIPHGEYRFMSNDDELLARIDSTYAILHAADRIQPIQNKWFYPERQNTVIAPWIWYVAAVLAFIALGALAYYIVLHFRKQKMTSLIRKGNARLALILQTANVRLFTYDIATRRFTIIGNDGTPQRSFTAEEFSTYMSPDDNRRLEEAMQPVISGEKEKMTLDIKARDESHKQPGDFVATLSVLRRDRYGKPTVLLATRGDITNERIRQKKAREMKQRYQSVFENAMVDMVYYDENGIIADMNQKCAETFQSTMEEMRAVATPVQKVIGIDDHSFKDLDSFHATLRLNTTEEDRVSQLDKHNGQMYYELQLVPVPAPDGRPLGFYGTGRDVTEVARTYMAQQESIKHLKEANDKVKSYIDNINYALRVGGVRIVDYSPDTHLLQVFSETNKAEYTLTQARCIHLCATESRSAALKLLDTMDSRTNKTLSCEITTMLHSPVSEHLQLQLHFIPTTGSDGRVESYFGICRDISEIKATEQQLEAETAKAQDVETVKNAFLRNMSYEIRTPLNTVVGFAELFQQDHSPDDEQIFINEIKDNSRKLLNLVNNILLLSRLDAHMIEFTRQPTDFAAIFASRCETGWAEYKRPGVDYLVDSNYSRFIVDIDDLYLSIIIGHIVTNAAQHTTSGCVRARFGYTGNQLIITVDDTGCGIAKENLSHIFERFATGANNGTGLGLSICHELALQMGGSISIKSEVGKGTTVWVSIPCNVTEFDRK